MVTFGIASVFTAMKGFELLAQPLTALPFINNFILSINDNILLSILTGAQLLPLFNQYSYDWDHDGFFNSWSTSS